MEAVHLAREPGGDLVDHKDREIFRHGEERGEREWGLAVGWMAEVGGAWESTLFCFGLSILESRREICVGLDARDSCDIYADQPAPAERKKRRRECACWALIDIGR